MAGQYVAIRRVDMAECNAAPRGCVDGVDATHAAGWAQDTDSPDRALAVHLYFGGPAGSPSGVGVAATANLYRPDLCTAIGSCAHGFDVAVPVAFLDGAPRPVHAYTFDSTTGAPVELPGSPRTLQAPPPAIPGGVRRHVVDEASFAAWHFSYPWVAREPDSAVAAVPEGGPLPAAPLSVQADDGTPEVWMVDGTERRHVVDPASAAAWLLDLAAVARWPAAQVYALSPGKPWRAAPFVFMGSSGAVYVMDDAPAPPPVITDAGEPGGGSGEEVPDGGSGSGSDAGQTVSGPGGAGCGCGAVGPGAGWVFGVMALAAASRRRPRRVA